MLNNTQTTKSLSRGQSMAEFSLVLPILMVVIFGLLEVGRAVFMFAAVTNASREAVRYATAYGVDESNVLHYQNCAEIRNEARRVAFLVPLADDDIVIKYDAGPDPVTGVVPSPFATCNAVEGDATNGVDQSVDLACGDRVVVSVKLHYHPMVSFVPMENQEFTTSSARTYVGVVELTAGAPSCN